MKLGIIVVDHGSRSSTSNAALETVARRLSEQFGAKYPIVEPAHMEMAEPTIAQALRRCVERGAGPVVVCPLFLAPGKHMTQDIPRLASEAAQGFPDIDVVVAPPLGVDDLILQLMDKRIGEALHATEVAQLERI